MKRIKSIICLFKGHVINTSESLVKDYMIDSRNWLCKCHRCGVYIMHDGAMSGMSVPMTKKQALETAAEFIAEVQRINDTLENVKERVNS